MPSFPLDLGPTTNVEVPAQSCDYPAITFDDVLSRFDNLVEEHRRLLCTLHDENSSLRKQNEELIFCASEEPKNHSDVEPQEQSDLLHCKSTNSSDSNNTVDSAKSRTRLCQNFVLLNGWSEELSSVVEKRLSFSRTSVLGAAIERGASAEHMVKSESGWGSRLILHPGSNTRLYWDLLSMILLAWDTLTIPFVLAFEPAESDAMHIITWVTMIFWTLDMPMSLITGFHHGKIIVLNPWRIAIDYLKARFWLDALIVSVDWILVVTESVEGGSAARLGRSLRILKLLKTLKLLRTLKLKKYIQAVQDQITSEAVSIWFGILRVVIILLFVNHLVACFWYTIGSMDCDTCEQRGWVMYMHLGNHTVAHRYVISLHWSLAQFTPAPNEIFPQNAYERSFATCVLVAALVCFSAFVSTVTAGVVQLRNMSNAESRAFWQLRRYLRDWEVPVMFRRRVVRYLEYAFHRQRRRVQAQDVALLSLLSEQLRVELRQQTLKGYLCWHALFSKLSAQARIFSEALGTKFLATGDLVFGCAEQAEGMTFVGSGHLEYVLGELDDLEPIVDSPTWISAKSLETSPSEVERCKDAVLIGQWVCEAALWISQWIHLGDLQAHSETQIISIHSKSFGNSVRMNRMLWIAMRKYAERFLVTLNQVSREELTDMLQDLCSPQKLLYRQDFLQPLNNNTADIIDASRCTPGVCATLWDTLCGGGKKPQQGHREVLRGVSDSSLSRE